MSGNLPERLGPYLIVRALGRGGMGVVFEGRDEESGERAAVKMLPARLGQDADFRSRFEAEIETLRRLRHRNIVRLLGFGHQGDQLFFAMELVEGQSMEQLIKAGRRFDWPSVLRFSKELAQALKHAHDRGIIHRDIKPANILVSADGVSKLSDFGIARLFGISKLTSPGSVIGTVDYMAPEQAEGLPIDPRADLYSLGAVMYACLARRPPFQAASLPQMLRKHREETVIPVKRLAPEVPPAMAQVIDRLLAKSPDDRYPNALVLYRRLQEVEDTVEITPPVSDDPKESDFKLGPASKPLNLPRTRSFGKDIPSGATRESVPASESAPDPSATGEMEGPDVTQVSADVPALTEVPPKEKTEAGVGGGPTRFTLVGEDELDRFEAVETAEESNPLISIQTWILAASLLAVGAIVWYTLQPRSADSLFDQVQSVTEDGSTDSLLDAAREIEEFLTNYPNDSRAKLLRSYAGEIELRRLAKKLERMAKGMSSSKTHLPIEHDTVEALHALDTSPEAGLEKFKAIVALYGTRKDKTGPNAQYVELAKRKVEQIEGMLAERAPSRLELIRTQLNAAKELGKTEPKEARRVYEAVITLYGDKPWASEVVEEAKKLLDAGK